MESVSECLEHSANDIFKRQIKEENTILKMCVRDKKDKVLELENTTLSADREPLFCWDCYTPVYKKDKNKHKIGHWRLLDKT